MMKRILLRVAVVAALLAIAALGVAGWHYSELILGPDGPPEKHGQAILARTDSTITLARTPKAERPGRWAIEWSDGYGELGETIARDSERVIRRFRLAAGPPPGTTARLAGFAFDADPGTWLGMAFDTVRVPASVGPLAAWLLPGADSTWAIFVHGRGATRAEVLRMLPAYRAAGLPCLVITYRNDAGAPQVDGGRYRLGDTEWRDLEDAVRFARARGARDVVLVGCSMGGGIIAQFLRRSPLASECRAAVLDAPALDWNAVLALAARQRRVPAWLTEVGKWIAGLRGGWQWSDLVQAEHASEFHTPMLILHGDGDETVPIDVSRRFAAARPDLVTFAVFPAAGHVESSNFDATRYRRVVGEWLAAHAIGAEPPALTAAAAVRGARR